MALQIGNGYDDLLGALEIGDAELFDDLADVGALPRGRYGGRGGGGRGGYGAMGRGGRMPRGGGGYGPGRGVNARRLIPMIPGAPAVGIRLQPLGFPTLAFTATSGTALTTTSRPQRPFKGKRLVVDVARTGATSTGLITGTQLSIGTNNQFVASQPIGVSAFAANAFDTNMELAACTTALDITLGFATSLAPTAPDRIDIAITIFGEAVG